MTTACSRSAGRLVLVVSVDVDDLLFSVTAAAVSNFERGLPSAFEAPRTKSGELTLAGLRVKTIMDEDTGA